VVYEPVSEGRGVRAVPEGEFHRQSAWANTGSRLSATACARSGGTAFPTWTRPCTIPPVMIVASRNDWSRA